MFGVVLWGNSGGGGVQRGSIYSGMQNNGNLADFVVKDRH